MPEIRTVAAGLTVPYLDNSELQVVAAGLTVVYRTEPDQPGWEIPDTYPTTPAPEVAEAVFAPGWHTEVVEYETGYTQRNADWIAPISGFRLRYPIVTDAEFRDLWNYFVARRGTHGTFYMIDFTEPNPVNKMIAVADGNTYEFKLPVDRMDTVTIYRDGAIDALAAVDTTTGVLVYAAPPPAGAVLTFDATNAQYLVRYARPMPSERHKFIAWGATVELVQVKMDQ